MLYPRTLVSYRLVTLIVRGISPAIQLLNIRIYYVSPKLGHNS